MFSGFSMFFITLIKGGRKSSGHHVIKLPQHQVIIFPPDGQSWQVFRASREDGCVQTHKQHTADMLSHSPSGMSSTIAGYHGLDMSHIIHFMF